MALGVIIQQYVYKGLKMQIKTSDLTGVALDWAVAKCEGCIPENAVYTPQDWVKVYLDNWLLCGEIIENNINKLFKNMGGTWSAQIKYKIPYYSTTYGCAIDVDAFINKQGNTPIEAALRCYVASKLGGTVEIPDELLNEV